MGLAKTISVDGVEVPRLFYGTAWKEESTEELVREALLSGFSAVDTANQRKHYYEVGVGRGLQSYCEVSGRDSTSTFLQTKFTFQNGQDERLPYDPKANWETQVYQSFESSLQHLNVKTIDSYMLHGPFRFDGSPLGSEDFQVWRAMETLKEDGKVQFLAVSNVSVSQLSELLKKVEHKPRFVQNRCFADQGWDRQVRELCRANGIVYQGFSLLTANIEHLNNNTMRHICEKYQKTVPQVVFRFCIQKQMIVITGTTSVLHMTQDLDIFDFELSAKELLQIEMIAAKNER